MPGVVRSPPDIEMAIAKAIAITRSDRFQGFVLGLIVLNALCLGAEAIPEIAEEYSDGLLWILSASQAIFVIEIVLRLAAYYPRPGTFFDDSWNRFDFAVVVASLLPPVGGVALAARVLRLFRVLRAVSVSETLRSALDRRPAVVPLMVVLLIVSYVFALSGFHLFGESNATDWGNLERAALSVLRLITVHDAPSLIAAGYDSARLSVLYFAAFYLAIGALLAQAVRGFAGARARERDLHRR